MIYHTAHNDQAKAARAYLAHCIEAGATVEVIRKRSGRSLPQNNYLHLLLGAVAVHTGYTIEEVKQLLKDTIAPNIMEYERDGHTFYRSTADLDTAEMSELTERLRDWSAKEIGVYLPEPNEEAHLASLANAAERYENKRWF